MLVKADNIKNAEQILLESVVLVDKSQAMLEATVPIAKLLRAPGKRKSPPMIIAETGRKLKDNFIESFEAEFPNLSAGVVDGTLGEFSYRAHDALYKLGNLLKVVKDKKFMIQKDSERLELHKLLQNVVADMCYFTIMTFNLNKAIDPATEECTMSVSRFCDQNKITPSVLYSILMEKAQATGCSYYAYEPLSEFYTLMQNTEPDLVTQCQEQSLPLTDDICAAIINGEVTANAVYDTLQRQSKEGTVVQELDITPSTLVSRMNLQ